jgi:hypothetical protein
MGSYFETRISHILGFKVETRRFQAHGSTGFNLYYSPTEVLVVLLHHVAGVEVVLQDLLVALRRHQDVLLRLEVAVQVKFERAKA